MRPLLAGGDPAQKYRALMAQRVPLYRRVATMRVNTNRRNPGAVVRYIVDRLENPDAPNPPAAAPPAAVAPRPVLADPGTQHRGPTDTGGRGRPKRERHRD